MTLCPTAALGGRNSREHGQHLHAALSCPANGASKSNSSHNNRYGKNTRKALVLTLTFCQHGIHHNAELHCAHSSQSNLTSIFSGCFGFGCVGLEMSQRATVIVLPERNAIAH